MSDFRPLSVLRPSVTLRFRLGYGAKWSTKTSKATKGFTKATKGFTKATKEVTKATKGFIKAFHIGLWMILFNLEASKTIK